MPARQTLDFIVIGAAKCGTTSFWRGLDSHPRIRTPSDKERGFFNSDARYARGLPAFLAAAFPGLEPGQVCGTVTPNYMSSRRVDTVVERMWQTVPDVRLIALLRDPVERTVSQFRQGVRVGSVRAPTLPEHLEAVGEDAEVVRNSEYGRILGRYLERFGRDQLLIGFTERLERDPQALYRDVFSFLGVDPAHEPPPSRLNVGGTASRVEGEAIEAIEEWMDENVWPRVEAPGELRRGLAWWLRYHWNTQPDEELVEIPPELRAELQRLFLADAELLRPILGADPPWAARYRRELRDAA
ncbi:MAG TPA: sulfotransferase domain-containing protein [Solirubrobacteraceae bacterium]|jgi:hypothetical protein